MCQHWSRNLNKLQIDFSWKFNEMPFLFFHHNFNTLYFVHICIKVLPRTKKHLVLSLLSLWITLMKASFYAKQRLNPNDIPQEAQRPLNTKSPAGLSHSAISSYLLAGLHSKTRLSWQKCLQATLSARWAWFPDVADLSFKAKICNYDRNLLLRKTKLRDAC